MSAKLIKHAPIVNEGVVRETYVRIKDQRIEQISNNIFAKPQDEVIEANGCWLLPGMIDDQVHFRESGSTHKGTIASESRTAVLGGITSYMKMPNINLSRLLQSEKTPTILDHPKICDHVEHLGMGNR